MIEFLEIFFFGQGSVQTAEPISMGAAALIGAGTQIIGRRRQKKKSGKTGSTRAS
jgi:hypothetical protein